MPRVMMLCVLISSFALPAQAERYPSKALESFLLSCVGQHRELITYCKCILSSFEMRMPYQDFEKMVQSGADLSNDKRMTTFANYCIDRLKEE